MTLPSPGRSFRFTALLAAIFVFHAFDLALTHSQMQRGNFAEANRIAAAMMTHGPVGTAAYKAVLLGVGVFILYRLRRHWIAELGAWSLALCGAGLMIWWHAYLDMVEICLDDPVAGALMTF